MTDWPKFVSHKVVQAAPIVSIGEKTSPGTVRVLVVEPNGDGVCETFAPTEPAMADRAEVGGYAVIYDDGFKSVSPKKAFEEGYTPQ
jgi:hypothetical protein